MSLLEMLFATSIVSITAAGLSALVMLNSMSTIRLFNKVDGLNAARQAIEKIGADVRQAQGINGQFGIEVANPSPPPVTLIAGVPYYPSPLNPFYGAGQAPPGGWPGWPWPAPPYMRSNTTLFVAVPVFYENPVNNPHDPAYNPSAPADPNNGFPTVIPAGTGNPATTVPYPNVDTPVYQVLPDPERSGEYMLQRKVFPGLPPPAPAKSRPLPLQPQTLLRGIVGPINPNTGLPQIFQYLDKTDPTGTPLDTVLSNADNITGVLINLEIKRIDAGTIAPSVVSLRSAVYMRNNTVHTP